MARQIRYGVIGAGAIAQRRHLPEIHANPRSVVVAVADPVRDRVAEVAERYGAQAFTDHKRMLADKSLKLDAVVVAGPNAMHASQAVEALRAGYHVLCEKPMAVSLPEGRKIIEAAKKARKLVMVGMNQRLMPTHAKGKEILDSGKLGRVITFETSFKHPGPDGWSVDGAKSWFFKKDPAGMGVCGDLGVHKADLIRFLLDDEVVKVGGFVRTLDKTYPNGKLITVDDNAFITMETAKGAIGTMNISWTHYGRFEDNGTTLYCEHGVMRLAMDPTYGVMVDYFNGQKERYAVGAVATNTQQVTSGVSDAFTDAILAGRKSPIDATEGLRSMSVVLTAIQAAKEGKMKKVPLK